MLDRGLFQLNILYIYIYIYIYIYQESDGKAKVIRCVLVRTCDIRTAYSSLNMSVYLINRYIWNNLQLGNLKLNCLLLKLQSQTQKNVYKHIVCHMPPCLPTEQPIGHGYGYGMDPSIQSLWQSVRITIIQLQMILVMNL